ncbi:hypothetical protein AVEN_171973-1 [Araneus ventricosus]|uniref:Uncharacterized protein n=1 Tax=Araneus ventricosus TaxID=182803 RepID=A0A4Y2W0R7_ARAVE|nr:hypothetical protein AVEN_171973-1 [Araneus ventricosus]
MQVLRVLALATWRHFKNVYQLLDFNPVVNDSATYEDCQVSNTLSKMAANLMSWLAVLVLNSTVPPLAMRPYWEVDFKPDFFQKFSKHKLKSRSWYTLLKRCQIAKARR